MAILDYTVDIVRGFPQEGALDSVETIKSGSTVSNGDWVEPQSDGTVDVTSSTATNVAGLVFRGNGDSGAGVATGKAVVLWSGFIARVSNYTAGSYVPGTKVTVVSGKLAVAGASDPVIGHVKQVVAAGTNTTAHIVVVIK